MIGWIANILMWVGSVYVGNRNRWGFVMQATGNAMWAWIGYYGLASENKGALIGVSIVFCVLYLRNFYKWSKAPDVRVFKP
jgi:hypothetical protein